MSRPDPIDEAFACLRQHEACIDEVHRARVWASIEKSRSGRPPWRRLRFAVAAVAASALCGGFVVWRAQRQPEPGSETRTLAANRLPAIAAPAPGAAALLVPYLVSGTTPPQLLDGAHAHVEVPAGGLMRATVGEQTRVTLLGPAELTVVSAGQRGIVLSFHHGMLLCDFDHREGTVLRVQSPGAETVVVGTLFSVEATGTRSIVSVARGRVEVVRGGRSISVDRGRRLLPEREQAEPLPAPVAERLAEHEAAVLPPAGDTGLLSVATQDAAEAVWLGGRLLGTPPLAARLPSGPVTLFVGGSDLRAAPGRKGGAHRIDTVVLPARTVVALVDDSPNEAPASASRDRGNPLPRPSEVPVPPSDPTTTSPPGTAERAPGGSDDTPSRLYARAEMAMKRGDHGLGRRTLQDLVEQFPDGDLASSAHYEIARMAFADGDWQGAGRALAEVQKAEVAPALREPAHYLRCRVEVARADRPSAEACLADFRRRFPHSPHDAEVLSLLASYRFDASCSSALPMLEEYLRRYPRGAFAEEAAKRQAHCPH